MVHMHMLEFSVARTENDFLASKRLVRAVYTEAGYVAEGEDKTAISAYLGKNGATTVLARTGDTLLGTISIVADVNGVPMDSIYREELASYRGRGAQIAEVCQFAIDKDALRTIPTLAELDVSVNLLGLAVQLGFEQLHDYLCFAINPKHRTFYESLGCTQIGNEKSYSSVSGAPALGYVLDMNAVRQAKESKERKHFLLTKIFDTELPENFFV